jgi:hypothetical protein
MNITKGIACRWRMRYFLEYAIALSVYLASTILCVPRALESANRSTRTLWLLGPCLGILLLSAAVIRHFLRVDEYMRRSAMEYFAAAGALVLICSLAYGFFELAGFPRVSTWWTLAIMSGGMLLWRLFRTASKR